MSSQNLQVEYKREVHGLKSNKITHDKKKKELLQRECCQLCFQTWGYKKIMLNSTEHEINPANEC